MKSGFSSLAAAMGYGADDSRRAALESLRAHIPRLWKAELVSFDEVTNDARLIWLQTTVMLSGFPYSAFVNARALANNDAAIARLREAMEHTGKPFKDLLAKHRDVKLVATGGRMGHGFSSTIMEYETSTCRGLFRAVIAPKGRKTLLFIDVMETVDAQKAQR